MTIITLWEENDTYYVRASGHANYGAHGKDILCASVSALTQSFVLYAQELEEAYQASIEYLCVVDGQLEIKAHGDLHGPFRMLHAGLHAISQQYPGYVQVVMSNGVERKTDNIL